MCPLQCNSNPFIMVIKIKFFTMAGGFFCLHKYQGGMAAAIAYVETLKKNFVISSVDVSFPDIINVTIGGAA